MYCSLAISIYLFELDVIFGEGSVLGRIPPPKKKIFLACKKRKKYDKSLVLTQKSQKLGAILIQKKVLALKSLPQLFFLETLHYEYFMMSKCILSNCVQKQCIVSMEGI